MKQQVEQHQIGSDQEGTGIWFKVPSKYFWPIVIGIFCGYAPAKDAITAVLPTRGEQRMQASRDQTADDNHQLLLNVAIDQASNSNIVENLRAESALHFKETDQNIKDVKQSIDKVNDRIDLLYERK